MGNHTQSTWIKAMLEEREQTRTYKEKLADMVQGVSDDTGVRLVLNTIDTVSIRGLLLNGQMMLEFEKYGWEFSVGMYYRKNEYIELPTRPTIETVERILHDCIAEAMIEIPKIKASWYESLNPSHLRFFPYYDLRSAKP